MQESVGDRQIGQYLDALGGEEPMPGGGSAAGIVGALAAATAEMVASLTREPGEDILAAKAALIELRTRALECARDDEVAYGTFLESLKLPKSTDEEKAFRKAELAKAMEQSARVPLALAIVAIEIINALEIVIRDGNKTVLGDAATSIVLAQATVDICEVNVNANLPFIKDEALADDLRTSIQAAGEMIVHLAAERRAQINERNVDSIT